MSKSEVLGAADPLPHGGGKQTGPVLAAPTRCDRCGKNNPAEIHTCTPLALRLADALDYKWFRWGADEVDERKAAAELRRLHAVNKELLDSMQRAIRRLEIEHAHGGSIMREWITEARAAIAKARGAA